MAVQWPAHFGRNFTSIYHYKAEGRTDPTKIKLPRPFVVLVTGAGKGLGFHMSLAYAQAGASGLIICSRTAEDLNKLSTEIRGINKDCEILSRVCDTTCDQDLSQLAKDVQTKFGRLDVAIANAGVISNYVTDADGTNRRLPLGVLEDPDFERVVNINLLGSYRVAKHFIPLLIATKDGPQSYLVISSVASHLTQSFITPVAYNLSKLANNRLAECIHGDHHAKDGINAFSIHPGAVLTPQTQDHPGEIWEHALTDDVGLCGGFCVWLTEEKRDWLSGRYVSVNWDVDELEAIRDEIVDQDKLKFRMVV